MTERPLEDWERPLTDDFYVCPNTGQWVYRWRDERMILIPSPGSDAAEGGGVTDPIRLAEEILANPVPLRGRGEVAALAQAFLDTYTLLGQVGEALKSLQEAAAYLDWTPEIRQDIQRTISALLADPRVRGMIFSHDFDRYCEERGIHDPKDYPQAFADWLAGETGEQVIGVALDLSGVVEGKPKVPGTMQREGRA
ncbi:MAG: hypothetical protein ACRDGM_19180 [bacterium]